MMMELRGVSVKVGERATLQPTDLQIPAGKTTVLLGPRDGGKSTLLRLLLLLDEPTTGQILFEGKPVTKANARETRQRMGYVAQDAGLFPHLTALGNLGFQARRLGWDEERITQRIHQVCKQTHWRAGELDHYPVELSEERRQRVALMRALMLDPDVLLLEEPLATLDPPVRHRMQEELRDIFRNLGKTVILETQNLGDAACVADEIVLLSAGRVVQQGTLTDLCRQPADPFVTDFLQSQRGPSLSDGEEA
jgi:osmoprotectant transport system ATP-binding protein